MVVTGDDAQVRVIAMKAIACVLQEKKPGRHLEEAVSVGGLLTEGRLILPWC